MDAPLTLYREARPFLLDGDVLLFRNEQSPIAVLGRGIYSHAAVVFWHGALNSSQRVLMVAEFREWHGARIVTLSSQVRRYPGQIDVFRPKCHGFIRSAAAELMVRQAGHDYSYAAVLKCALLHAPGIRWGATKVWNPRGSTLSEWGDYKHCSQAVTWTYRTAARRSADGFDLCPGLADWAVEPTHLEHSAALDKMYTRLTHAIPETYAIPEVRHAH